MKALIGTVAMSTEADHSKWFKYSEHAETTQYNHHNCQKEALHEAYWAAATTLAVPD